MDNVRTLRPAARAAATRSAQIRDLIHEAQALIELSSNAVTGYQTMHTPSFVPHPAIVRQVLDSAHARLGEAVGALEHDS